MAAGRGVVINSTAVFLGEYNSRMRMKELGFTENLQDLDALTAECFSVISQEIATVREEKESRDRRKRGR